MQRERERERDMLSPSCTKGKAEKENRMFSERLRGEEESSGEVWEMAPI